MVRCAFVLLFFVCMSAVAATAQAEPAPAGLPALAKVTISTIRPDFTLVDQDGRLWRLAGVEAPVRPLREPSDLPWPPTQRALAALRTLTAGDVSLYDAGCPPDRWGRRAVQMASSDHNWIQGTLLAQGLVRVHPQPDCDAVSAPLLDAETPARHGGIGVWAEPETRVQSAERLNRWIDSWQVVEGTIYKVHPAKTAVYLDFGADWRRSLGVKIPYRLLGRLPGNVLALAGRQVRVRGWVGKRTGPMMEIHQASQIEVVGGWPASLASSGGETER